MEKIKKLLDYYKRFYGNDVDIGIEFKHSGAVVIEIDGIEFDDFGDVESFELFLNKIVSN